MKYRFLDFQLDTETREFSAKGEIQSLEPQVFDLLAHLVENSDRLVSRDELIEQVWSGRVVSDSAIDARVSAARHAVGDTGKSQAVIKTVPRRGFRFVGGVVSEDQPDEPNTTVVSMSEPVPGFSGKPAIAVLAFENLSQDPDQDFLADGIAEDILTRLAMWRWLPVIARHSSFIYRGRAVDVKKVGLELGARYVLEGSVRRAGNRVRITGQLIDSETGHHVWADRYDRDLDDIFVLQDEIADAVVAALEPAVGRAEMHRAQRKMPTSLDAWDLYQRGMSQLTKATHEGLQSARNIFQQSTQVDPDFAPPFAGMALADFVDNTIGFTSDGAMMMAAAHDSAVRAVSLDDLDPFAHAALAYTSFSNRDHETAVAAGRRAIELNPSFALGYHALGASLFGKGDHDEAIHYLQTAIRISPNDPWLFLFIGGLSASFYMRGDYQEAAEAAAQGAQRFPWYPSTLRWLAVALAQLERTPEARTALDKFIKLAPHYTLGAAAQSYAFRRQEDLEHYLDGLCKAGLSD